MSTLVTSTNISISEARSRTPLLALRSSHADVSQYNKVSLDLGVGESKQFVCDRFAYFHIRDKANVTITTATGTISLPDASGSFSLPIACTITFSVPGTSTILLDRKINIVYG